MLFILFSGLSLKNGAEKALFLKFNFKARPSIKMLERATPKSMNDVKLF
jgi:hypothetical protein